MRAWAWAIVAVVIWLVAAGFQHGPVPIAADAPPGQFSALRAQTMLRGVLGPELPHPVGSPQDAALRGRLLQQLSALHVPVQIITRMSCTGGATIKCATISDVLADVLPGPGKAVLLMAHMDSVPAGPGAGDDGAGVATLLETIRALKAEPGGARHPVMALFSDGEEYGLLGAAAFANNPEWRARVGVVINVDARGDAGQSLLFQTSAGDAGLIDLYASSVAHPATSSLFGEIYKYLHNDTDLTPFLQAGLAGYNFANVDDVAAYHTPLDRLDNLSLRTLQSHGDNALGLTRGLQTVDFAALKSGKGIYLDVLSHWLPRLPASWALPLSLLAFAVLALLFWRQRARGRGPGQHILAFLAPPVLVIGAGIIAFALQAMAAALAHAPDPAFAQPLYLRAALFLSTWALLLAVARGATLAASWLWLAGLAILTAILLPGLCPYFLFPVLVAMVVLPFAARRRWLAAVPALAALVIWLQLTVGIESLTGLSMAYLFAIPLALALLPIAPAVRGGWIGAGLVAGLSLLMALVAGFTRPYDAAHPQPVNLLYVERGGHSELLRQPVDLLPVALRAPVRFPLALTWLEQQGYAAPTGTPRLSLPGATVTRRGGDVTLDIHAGAGIILLIPKTANLASATINGVSALAPGAQVLFCLSADCGHAHIVLHGIRAGAATLTLMEWRLGLPDPAMAKQRPANSAAMQFGDMSVLLAPVPVPAR